METDKDHYFLTGTANRIWQGNDLREEEKLFGYISAEKESFFRRVMYKNSSIPDFKLRDLAETAFLAVWEDFSIKARAGNLGISNADYRGYFYQAFKNNYLRLLSNEMSRLKAEHNFMQSQPENASTSENRMFGAFSDRTMAVLRQTGEGCRELLTWRFVDNLTYDEIVAKRKGTLSRASAIKVLARCKKRFLTIWNSLN